jgi:predicted metal-dependent HD superfamily phosphohydrolase
MNYNELLKDVETYIDGLVKSHQTSKLYYHDLVHTKMVVAAVKQIGDHYQLNEKDFFIVVTAAWFHDIAYYTDAMAHHEEHGAELATNFLVSKNVGADIIKGVSGCILATKMPQQPNGLLEEIICDADMFHLGTDDFKERNKLMRKETRVLLQMNIDKNTWRSGTIRLMQQQHYFTDYCRLLLDDKKQDNLDRLFKKQGPEIGDTKGNTENISAKQKEKEKATDPGRGIETMFRVASGNNQRQSNMADNKAHILITVNSIILSALISLVLRRLDEANAFTYPTFALLAVSVTTIVVGILATRPNIHKESFTKQDISDKKTNLLFFGSFHKMSLDVYTAGMLEMMKDRDLLYRSLIKDVYSQGMVLNRKYRLLRLAYNIFMIGLVISIIGYVIATLFNK